MIWEFWFEKSIKKSHRIKGGDYIKSQRGVKYYLGEFHTFTQHLKRKTIKNQVPFKYPKLSLKNPNEFEKIVNI